MRRLKAAFCIGASLGLLLMQTALARVLVPGGQSIGVAVRTDGLVVIGMSDIGGTPSPARLAGLKPGDVIQRWNGEEIRKAEDLTNRLTKDACVLTVLRGGGTREVRVVPEKDPKDGRCKLGVWVRDSAMGIGTLTYYDPNSGKYGALGHAVTDADAGIALPLTDGAIYESQVVDVEKGKRGRPGEIVGQFYDGGMLGDVKINSPYGIFGSSSGAIGNSPYPGGVETAGQDQVRTGSASILTTIGEEGAQEYACEIVRLEPQKEPSMRSMTLRITDERLLSATGGIVQGMSGSPILQDGKIVGAVTHVYVDDPTMGYGVYIDWMLSAEAA